MKLIAAKMIEVMKECSHVLKNGTNNFHAYKYATCADVLEKVNASFVKHGISTMAVPDFIYGKGNNNERKYRKFSIRKNYNYAH